MQRRARVIDSINSNSDVTDSDSDCAKSMTISEEVKFLKKIAFQHESQSHVEDVIDDPAPA